MRTIKLILAYDGTAYAGFQRQPNGITIQQRLEEALRAVTGEPELRIGAAAGRTDAGVHARGQVVHLRTRATIPIDRWPAAVNSRLPDDIAVVGAEAVPPEFHARYWAREKRYRYTFCIAPYRLPLARLYSYHWPRPVDVDAMREAAALLVGRHDFAAFRATRGVGPHVGADHHPADPDGGAAVPPHGHRGGRLPLQHGADHRRHPAGGGRRPAQHRPGWNRRCGPATAGCREDPAAPRALPGRGGVRRRPRPPAVGPETAPDADLEP